MHSHSLNELVFSRLCFPSVYPSEHPGYPPQSVTYGLWALLRRAKSAPARVPVALAADATCPHGGLVEFELIETLNIAFTLSCNVLQLCNTPWLGEIISLDNIRFFRDTKNPRCYALKVHFPAPFLVRQSSRARHFEKTLRPVNFALLTLGVLLIHIIMGRQVESIHLNKDMAKERWFR